MSHPAPALYKTIYENIKARILTGELAENSRLPTEAELMTQYGVSRITAKRALDELQNDGLIRRQRGSGSYVNAPQTGGDDRSRRRIGLLLPSPAWDTISHMGILQGATDYALRHNGRLVLFHSNRSEQAEQQLLMQAWTDGCDGVLYYPGPVETGRDILLRMAAYRYPVVMLDKTMDGVPVSTVVSDNAGGARALGDHLLGRGCRHILYLSSGPDLGATIGDRYLGLCRAVAAAGLPADTVRTVGLFADKQDLFANVENYDEVAIRRLTDRLPGWLAEGVDAIFALNDNLAAQITVAAKAAGLSIPGDFALAGFDDATYAPYTAPPLTTVRQDFYAMGHRAARQVLRQIENPEIPVDHAVIPAALVVRESA